MTGIVFNQNDIYNASIDDLCIGLKYYVKGKDEISYIEHTVNSIELYHLFIAYLNSSCYNVVVRKITPNQIVDIGFKKTVDYANETVSKRRFLLYNDKGEVHAKIHLKDDSIITIIDETGYVVSNGVINNIYQLYYELIRTKIIKGN